ncbi:MAG: hypothetical protein ACKO9Q_26205, partial [Pirellula sp.]
TVPNQIVSLPPSFMSDAPVRLEVVVFTGTLEGGFAVAGCGSLGAAFRAEFSSLDFQSRRSHSQ